MTLRKFFKYSLPIGIAGILLNVILFASNLFYELVVPVIENSSLSGSTFKFFDNLIFFTPIIFLVLFVAYLIVGQIYLHRFHQKEEDKVSADLNKDKSAKQNALNEKAAFLRKKFYSNCPNCGSVRVENEEVCSYCGTSLLIEKKEKE